MAKGGGSAWAFNLGAAAMVAVCTLAAISSVQAMDMNMTTFPVGGANGWALPAAIGNFSYPDWAANNTFHEGDSLNFLYNASRHNVLSVTGPKFNVCDFTEPLWMDATGNTTFPLKAGNYWFVCSVGTHCQLGGMKFKVSVKAMNSNSAFASARALPALLGALGIAAAYFSFF